MDRSEALRGLDSASQRERLEAARVLGRVASEKDLAPLRAALRSERLPWIRSALESAISRATVAGDSEASLVPLDLAPLANEDALVAEIYARATEELTDRFVHELRPLLGLARVWAAREIDQFEKSETAGVLTQMQNLLRAIDTLGRAAASPRTIEFDLAQLMHEIAASSEAEVAGQGEDGQLVRLDGPAPLMTKSDPDLISLAVRNGIRNAIEASVGSAEPVVVTWGQSHAELWVAVLDAGVGLALEQAQATSPGISTKDDHLGMGLAIARQAMSSLAGSLVLESTNDGMTRFAIACPPGPNL